MKVGQEVEHEDYGRGTIESIYYPDKSGNFKGGVTIQLEEVEGIIILNRERSLFPGLVNDSLVRVFENVKSKYKAI